jgi:hypothetical protein
LRGGVGHLAAFMNARVERVSLRTCASLPADGRGELRVGHQRVRGRDLHSIVGRRQISGTKPAEMALLLRDELSRRLGHADA